MRNWIALLLALCMAAICGSCYRQEDFNRDMFADSGIEYDIAIPLTDTRLTMENLIDLQGGLFIPDDTNLLHIIYAMEPNKANLMEDIALGQVSPFVFTLSEIVYNCMKDTLISIPFVDTIYFNIEGTDAEIKTLYFSEANVLMSNRNTFRFPMDVEMRFNNVESQSGEQIIYRSRCPEQGNKDTVLTLYDIKIQVDGAERPYIALSGTSKVNVLYVEGDNNSYKGSMYVSCNFREMDFRRADGYFSPTNHTIKGEMSMAGMGVERMTNIKFEQALIIADLEMNGVSAPVRFTSTNVQIQNMEGDHTNIPLFPENYDVAYPAITDNPLYKKSSQSTPIENMLIDRPYAVTYAVDALVNPDNDRTQLQAMEKDGNLTMALTCDIPLYFSADQYALLDTLVVSLDNLNENTELTYFDVKSIVKNAFPLNVVFSLHFLDANYKHLITLFHDDLIVGGRVGPAPDLHVEEPTLATFEDLLDVGEMALARQMRYVVVDARISSTDNQTVKVYVDGEKEGFVDVKVGIRIKVNQKGLLGK